MNEDRTTSGSKRTRKQKRTATAGIMPAAAKTKTKRRKGAKATQAAIEKNAPEVTSAAKPAPEAPVSSTTTEDEAKAAPARSWLRTGLGIAAGAMAVGALIRGRS